MNLDSSSVYFYDPIYIFFLLLFLGLIYIPLLGISFFKVKLSIIGIGLQCLSIIIYLLVGIYMVQRGYYQDGHATDQLIYSSYGFLELILLTYPYIFLALATTIGKKD
ncbi:hypothetical protein [Bacillus alkalicellulosilyticus]|uniref:hypothetical protein n=1 Tax=Alkalihalobacterium alkalicellulosilyticum TaxID=1912214 RepID=UPI0009960821|nr:hypothetical protein [Bacillus alkalicellulosilyticus]